MIPPQRVFTHTSYPKPFIRLRPSTVVKGEIGAFAMKSFKKGEVIVLSKLFEDNNVMSVKEYDRLNPETKDLVKAHSTITIDKVFMPANLNLLRPINYFNHSCDPNTGFDLRDNYIAIKNIPRGTEFLLDYSFLNTNPNYMMNCRCGSKNCRKKVTGNEWKNEKFVQKNRRYLYSDLRKLLGK